MNNVVLESVLTCPHCGFAKREAMPTDACQFYYECGNCRTVLRRIPVIVASSVRLARTNVRRCRLAIVAATPSCSIDVDSTDSNFNNVSTGHRRLRHKSLAMCHF